MSVESFHVGVDRLVRNPGRSGTVVEVVGSAADAVGLRSAGQDNGLTGGGSEAVPG
jgi:hypothetical protein